MNAMLLGLDQLRRQLHRLFARQIEWTDFAAPGVRFYFCSDTLVLPSEY